MARGIRNSVGFNFEWEGIKEMADTFQKAIDRSPKKTDAVIKNSAEKMGSLAKGYAPKDTGFLANNITTSHSFLDSTVTSGAHYAGYQEWGTRFQPGTKHIRPALEDIRPELEKGISDVARGLFG